VKHFIGAVVMGTLYPMLGLNIIGHDWWKITLGLIVGSIIALAAQQ
jgi:hypothetical protein